MNKIETLTAFYELDFSWRIIFVNKWTVRLLGKAKPDKAFVKSNFEARKKSKSHFADFMPAMEMPKLDHSEAEKQAEFMQRKSKT